MNPEAKRAIPHNAGQRKVAIGGGPRPISKPICFDHVTRFDTQYEWAAEKL